MRNRSVDPFVARTVRSSAGPLALVVEAPAQVHRGRSDLEEVVGSRAARERRVARRCVAPARGAVSMRVPLRVATGDVVPGGINLASRRRAP